MPKKKKLKTDADKAAEKAQHLRFGKAELTPDELSRLSKAQKREMYAAHAARSAVHREVDQYEDENVGVQALSEGEKAAGNVRDISKSRYARKLKKKAKMQGKKGTKTAKSSASEPNAAQDAGASGTSEGGSNWLSRWKQRQEIHKSYYAAARSGTAAQTAGGKAASNGASAARSGVEQAVEKGKTAVSTAVKGLMNAAKGNAHVLVIVGVFLLLILMVMSGFSSCGILFSGGTQVSGQTMYSAEDRDIRGAEQDYKKLEKELNTDGRVPNNRLPDYIKAMAVDSTYTAGAYKYCHIAHNRTDGMFVPFWPLSHPKSKPYTWGYDAIAYYWLEQLFQEDFYVIKWAIGGTAIAAPVTTPFRGTYWSADPKWLAENTATSEKGKSLLLSLIANIDASIDQTLSKLKQGYQIDAFVWHQGESDYEHGKEYYQNLKGVVSYVRNHLTEKTGKDYSELPFIFGTVSRKNKRYNSDVEEGMRRYAKEDKNAYLIDMSEAELMGDKLHFNQVSAEYMGKQVYEQIKKTLSDDPHVYVAKYKGDRACAISYTFDDASFGLAQVHFSV